MPIINGLKMACEPCIRGHRSTKCTHAKERLMVPVRKPGRPLSVCPHPPGKACGCGGITAAIPRAQKCGCGPDTNSETPTSSKSGSESSVGKGCTSPTRRAFQVQKSGSSRSNGRKQSFDISTLERMNPDSFNIVPPPPYKGPSGNLGSMPGSNGEKSLPKAVTQPSLEFLSSTRGMFDGYSNNGTDYSLNQHINGGERITSPVIKAETPRPHHTNGSSYFNGTHPVSSSDDMGSTPRVGSNLDNERLNPPLDTPRSCCGNRSKGKDMEPHANGNGPNNRHVRPNPLAILPNGMSHNIQQFQMQHVAPNGAALNGLGPVNPMMTAFHQSIAQSMYFPAQTTDPSIYTYPPFYGTYQYPIQPAAHWRPSMMNYGAQNIEGLPLGGLTQGPSVSEALSHQCTCGDSCNCLGCPAHPYNDATQAYVRSAMNSMSEGSSKNGQPLQNGGDHTIQLPAENISPVIPTAPLKSSCCSTAQPEPASTSHPSSPPQAQTPSEASVASEDQVPLSASDFLFVTYPFGCEGEVGSCLCGDDCSCVGCLIHGNAGNSLDHEA
ncbi:hypothetical protein MCOR25_002925 [Pyricularia grisea]|nr:hypothetical protein MCOR25_002925 [Pyricularia grisea]